MIDKINKYSNNKASNQQTTKEKWSIYSAIMKI